MVTTRNEYNPDYSVHPGEILFETLEARDITHSELAARTGLSLKTVSQITNSRAPITSETAIQLERVLGISATLWNNLDANYRLHQARVASRKVNERRLKWLDGFPIRELTQLGVLPSGLTRPEKLERLLEFFGVASPRAWKTRYRHLAVSFRKSLAFKSSLESVSCWLRLGELEAERVETAPYNKTKFRRALKYIRKLTVLPPGVAQDFITSKIEEPSSIGQLINGC